MIRMKKVLNDLEWTYEKFVDTEFIEGGAFVFRNKESNNVLMVDKAKFVFKDLNIVVHLDNCKQILANISESNIKRLSVKNPQLATRLNSLLNVSARRREQKERLAILDYLKLLGDDDAESFYSINMEMNKL
jgi:hypothetical protein